MLSNDVLQLIPRLSHQRLSISLSKLVHEFRDDLSTDPYIYFILPYIILGYKFAI